MANKRILSYSFQTLSHLHAAYAFTSKRYHGPIALYKSHRVSNYDHVLVFLEPNFDEWGNDEDISGIVSHQDLDVRIGDRDKVPLAVLIEQADALPFPTVGELKEAEDHLARLKENYWRWRKRKKWWQVWKR